MESQLILSERAKKDLKSVLLSFVTFFTFYLFFFVTYQTEFIIETTGMLSALIETTVPIPQFFSNYQNKSCKGLSKVMIFFWLLGDISRLFFFINRSQPIQFTVCSGIQICFDLSIIYQFYIYRDIGGINIKTDKSFPAKEINDEEDISRFVKSSESQKEIQIIND